MSCNMLWNNKSIIAIFENGWYFTISLQNVLTNYSIAVSWINWWVNVFTEGSQWFWGKFSASSAGTQQPGAAGLSSVKLALSSPLLLFEGKGNFRGVSCMRQNQLEIYGSSAPAALGSSVTQRWCMVISASSAQALHHGSCPDLYLCPIITSLACFVLFSDFLSTF